MIGGASPHCRGGSRGFVLRAPVLRGPYALGSLRTFLPDVESAFEDVRAQERVGDAHDVFAAHAVAGDRLERYPGGAWRSTVVRGAGTGRSYRCGPSQCPGVTA